MAQINAIQSGVDKLRQTEAPKPAGNQNFSASTQEASKRAQESQKLKEYSIANSPTNPSPIKTSAPITGKFGGTTISAPKPTVPIPSTVTSKTSTPAYTTSGRSIWDSVKDWLRI